MDIDNDSFKALTFKSAQLYMRYPKKLTALTTLTRMALLKGEFVVGAPSGAQQAMKKWRILRLFCAPEGAPTP